PLAIRLPPRNDRTHTAGFAYGGITRDSTQSRVFTLASQRRHGCNFDQNIAIHKPNPPPVS
ncbi:MAG: hypothetical protein ORN49_12705, partial [Rhodobacteraceae bacterium]|nr:hypothetical protein [Paracoccaceae bacterium]